MEENLDFFYINHDIGYDLNKMFESAIPCRCILKTHEQNRISNNSALITLHGVHLVAKIYVIKPGFTNYLYLYVVDIGSPLWLFFSTAHSIDHKSHYDAIFSVFHTTHEDRCLVYTEGILFHCKKSTLFFSLLAHLCGLAGLRSTS